MENDTDYWVTIIVAITSILVLTIIAALIYIWRRCHTNGFSLNDDITDNDDKPDIEIGILTNLMFLLKVAMTREETKL